MLLVPPVFLSLHVLLPPKSELYSHKPKLTYSLGWGRIVLGQTGYARPAANGATELLLISYWRSLDAVHAYAHGPLHRAAVRWWESTLKEHEHIGFMHEVFEAPRGMWESLYVNFQPTCMGATTYLRRKGGGLEGGKVTDEWVSPLLGANRGVLRTNIGRRGGDVAENLENFGKNVYG
jgi:hypothetical protein